MKINNNPQKNLFKAIYIVILIGLISCAIIKYSEFHFLKLFPIDTLLIAIFSLLLFYIMMGYQIFEFDCDGEAINIKNEDALMGEISKNYIKNAEFPKHKIAKYTISQFLFKKTLTLFLKSSRKDVTYSKIKYNITYLNTSKTKMLRQSLDQVVEKNIELSA